MIITRQGQGARDKVQGVRKVDVFNGDAIVEIGAGCVVHGNACSGSHLSLERRGLGAPRDHQFLREDEAITSAWRDILEKGQRRAASFDQLAGRVDRLIADH